MKHRYTLKHVRINLTNHLDNKLRSNLTLQLKLTKFDKNSNWSKSQRLMAKWLKSTTTHHNYYPGHIAITK